MIKMLPDHIASNINSQAEARLFHDFKTSQTAHSYIILHSLGMQEHINNIFGKIDFVVICSQGILCVEVKGGDVSCKNGVWEFVNRYGRKDKSTEGPFKQAQGNMQSLRRYLSKRLGQNDSLVSCQYASCVIMPDCQFTYRGIEMIQEILFDKIGYKGLDEMAIRSFAYWREQLLDKHGFTGHGLDDNDMARLASLLRGDFHFVPSMKASVDGTAEALCALTAEQYVLLESLEDNLHILVSGGAGTGKTMLAMEQARRWCLSGRKVKYVCFNKNIAEYVKYQFEQEKLTIDVSTLHAAMLHGNLPESNTQEFFEHTLPAQFIHSEIKYEYDCLIVDEGQDLFRDAYLPCLEKMVTGGLQNGKWLMFYDQNQNLYNDNTQLNSCISRLKKYGTATFKLSINCRNTKQIADANVLLTGISGGGRPKASGLKVKYIPYDNKTEEHEIIDDLLVNLKDDGICGNDLVILSKYSINNSDNCLYRNPVTKNAGVMKTLGQIWNADNNEVRFSTISGFKGLEAKVVILIDIDGFSDSSLRILNYVAISRACSLLYLLYDKNKEDERQTMLASNCIKLL